MARDLREAFLAADETAPTHSGLVIPRLGGRGQSIQGYSTVIAREDMSGDVGDAHVMSQNSVKDYHHDKYPLNIYNAIIIGL